MFVFVRGDPNPFSACIHHVLVTCRWWAVVGVKAARIRVLYSVAAVHQFHVLHGTLVKGMRISYVCYHRR